MLLLFSGPLRRACLRTPVSLLILLCLPAWTDCHAQANAAVSSRTPSGSTASAVQAPSWLSSAVVYEIFPRDFSAEGNLNGITARLDYLDHLGVNVLWLMPINPTGEEKKKGSLGSPYAIRDYYGISSAYGTKSDLLRLVTEAHKRNMRVILDVVLNHTSWDSTLMQHPDFYKHDASGKILYPYNWTDVAALDYRNPDLRRSITDMLVFWMRTFDIDGFRFDAAGEMPTDFWAQVRTALKAVKPDSLLLGESSKPDLMQKAFDLDYAWPLLDTLDRVIRQGVPATAIHTTWTQEERTFPEHTQHLLMSDNHDKDRAVVLDGAPAALAASVMMFTLPGVPLLYNGMEIGDAEPTAGPALFEKLPIFWAGADAHRDFVKTYAALIPLRKDSVALRTGELTWVHNSDETHVVTFLRSTPEESYLVAINLSNTLFRGNVEGGAGSWQEVPLGAKSSSPASLPALSLDAFQFRIFRTAPVRSQKE